MNATVTRLGVGLVLLVLVVAAAMAWRHWSDDSNTLPIESVLRADQRRPIDVAENVRPVILPDPEEGGRFLFVNPTRFPVEYTGYLVTTYKKWPPRGNIEPFYEVEQKNAGNWQTQRLGWCGTGAGTMIIPPGRAGRFRPSLAEAGTLRVGIHCRWAHPADGPQTSVIWSEPVHR